MTTVDLQSYIYKVLKQVHPDTGLTSEAKESVNTLLNLVLEKLVWLASDRVQLRGKKTLQTDDIAFAVTFLLVGSLQKHTVSEHAKALTKWSANSSASTGGVRTSSAALAGLTFPPTRIENFVRKIGPSDRVSKLTGVSLAAILEYLTAEILELAGYASRDDKKVQIAAKHIDAAITGDAELGALFEGVLLPGGFVKHQKQTSDEGNGSA